MAQPQPAGQAGSPRSLLAERRAWIRYPTNLESLCQSVAEEPDDDLWWQAKVRDISVGGIGLVLNHRFKPGTILSVELPNTDQSPFFLRLARVVHATAQADGSWVIGCEFATRLSADDLRALTGASHQPAAAPPAQKAGVSRKRGRRPKPS